MDVWKVGPILSSSTEGLPVANIWIFSFDSLDLVLDETVISRWDSLSLLWRSINRRGFGNLMKMMIHSTNRNHHCLMIQHLLMIVHHQIRCCTPQFLQKVMGRGQERGGRKMKLWVGRGRRRRRRRRRGREKKSPHVDRQEVTAVPTSHRHCLEQATAWHTHGEDSVTEVAVNIAKLVGGGGERKVVDHHGRCLHSTPTSS